MIATQATTSLICIMLREIPINKLSELFQSYEEYEQQWAQKIINCLLETKAKVGFASL